MDTANNSPATPVSRQRRILVVDDDGAFGELLSKRLSEEGYGTAVVADGSSALTLVAHTKFDLVLLDVQMPGLSGFDVLSQLRSTYSRSELPVIMVTGRCGSDDVAEALKIGANDYLNKPVDFQLALARIETSLAHKHAVEELRDSEERYALTVHGANDGLWDWNITTGQVYWSPRWKSILGLHEIALTADPNEWLSRVHPEDSARVQSAIKQHLATGTGHFECEHRLRHRDDSFRWVLCRGAVVRNDEGEATRFAGSLTDITESKLADALTGLPNRFLFLDVVERAIKRGERRGDYGFAVLVLALDRFRIVHDSLGASAADRLLLAVARRLQASLRGTDLVTRDEPGVTLARLGGDEFNVLVDDITDASAAVAVAERLRRALELPFEVDGHRVFATARIGIAMSTPAYARAEEVLRDATIALNRAMASSTVPYEIFDPEMRQRAVARLMAETDLRQAVEKQSFEVHYQPIVSLKNGRIVAFEALVRWRHPVRGLVQPPEFIDIAEDTGLIIEIDRLTLAESCRQMAAWKADYGAAAPSLMCANVSSRQFAAADLATEISTTLRASGLTPGNLKLEITERAFVHDVPTAQVMMNRARAMGVAWSLDDFGTGYSSLSLLQRLQIDTLKVDRQFVSAIGPDGNGAEMVRAIVGLAHTLGMDVVAEGVETAEQASELRSLGCEYAQGFYFSRAVDTVAAARLIESQPWQRTREQHLVQ
ncbi:MAG TPA: EAL domain-containing protein [Vicinamibacterales bacterium]|nr:EAL domain-containing protein [Vicinamibacterales bacterium]